MHMHTYSSPHRNDFKKPGTVWPECTWFTKIDSINIVKPEAETIMKKGRKQEALTSKFSAIEKAWLAKCTAEYGLVNKQYKY